MGSWGVNAERERELTLCAKREKEKKLIIMFTEIDRRLLVKRKMRREVAMDMMGDC